MSVKSGIEHFPNTKKPTDFFFQIALPFYILNTGKAADYPDEFIQYIRVIPSPDRKVPQTLSLFAPKWTSVLGDWNGDDCYQRNEKKFFPGMS